MDSNVRLAGDANGHSATSGWMNDSGWMNNSRWVNYSGWMNTLENNYADWGMYSYDYDDQTPPLARVIRDVILPVICACGIVGIVLTVIVLTRKNMSTSTNCYLIGLSVSDCLFLLLLFCMSVAERGPMEKGSRAFYVFQVVATYMQILMNVCLLASIWTTVILAVERYFAICQPFMVGRLPSVRRARQILILNFFICCILRLPSFFAYRVSLHDDVSTNQTWVYILPSEFSTHYAYSYVYPWIVDVTIMSVVPFVLLATLNICLMLQVRKSNRYIQSNLINSEARGGGGSSVQREELQIAGMLISVIVVFFICQGPYVFYTAAISTHLLMTHNPQTMLYFLYTAQLLLTLKSALNFALYCWFSEKFWLTLKRLVCVRSSCVCCHPAAAQYSSALNGLRHCPSTNGNTRVTCTDV